jgi:DNA-binding transcriptional MocR family regulator
MLPDVLQDQTATALMYATGPSTPKLGEALAEHHRVLDGVDLAPTQIVATNGTAGGIALVAQLFLEPGDVVICEDLTYWGAVASFRLQGAELRTVPLDEGGLVVEALADLLDQLAREGKRVKLLYTIAACQSPTGSVLDEGRRTAVAELCRRHGIAILQDDTYGEIRFERDRFPRSFLACAPERTIHLGSFSKTIATGLRLGWLATSPEIAAAAAGVRTDLGTTAIIQLLVAEFVRSGQYDAHVAGGAPFYQHKRDLLLQGLQEHCAPWCDWTVPPGGYYLWVTLKQGTVEPFEALAEAEGVSFLAGPHFSPTRVADEGFRLAYGEVAVDDITEGARRLGRALEAAAEKVGASR